MVKFFASGRFPDEQTLDILLMFIWLFVAVNLNSLLGFGYFCFTILYFLMREEGRKRDVVYPISREPANIYLTLVVAGVFAFGFLYIANGLFPGGAKVIGSALMQSLALSSLPLPLALFIGAVLVPTVEEKFFRGGLLPLIQTKIENKYFAALVNGAAFALWHLGVYKITNNSALTLAMIFGTVMSLIVLNKMELKWSILIHCIFNGIVLLLAAGFTSIMGYSLMVLGA